MSSQKTLAGTLEFDGVGIHSGAPCRAVVRPAPEGTGLVFRRVDLEGSPVLGVGDLLPEPLPARTTLGRDGVSVETVEHMLAALWAMGVDDAEVEADGPEMPAMDGSALPFARAVAEAGLVELGAARSEATVVRSIEIEENGAAITASPEESGLRITYELHYEGSPLAQGKETFELSPEVFLAEIAPARTFCMASEVEALRKAGLGKGATGKNTLVISGDEVIGNELRLPEEPLRHKVLDMVGDMALIGARLRAHLEGRRSGHALNRRLAARIRSAEPGEVAFAAPQVGAPRG